MLPGSCQSNQLATRTSLPGYGETLATGRQADPSISHFRFLGLGHIGGNDLPPQGQRQLLQHFRVSQQNDRSFEQYRVWWRISFGVVLLKFFVYFLCIFNTLPCIPLLSLCFGSACPPLTLLQLRYILWCFICLFQDNILGFNMCFPIRCLGFYGCLCISYALFLVMIFLIIAPQPFVFMHIIWHLVGWISGSNMFALIFLTLFSLYFSCAYGRALFYK